MSAATDVYDGYPERGSTSHLARGTEKSLTCAVAAVWSQAISLRMKKKSFLTSIFVSEKTGKRAQRINVFLKADGHESKTETVSVSDLFLQGAVSKE
jgi:hypothetical protein